MLRCFISFRDYHVALLQSSARKPDCLKMICDDTEQNQTFNVCLPSNILSLPPRWRRHMEHCEILWYTAKQWVCVCVCIDKCLCACPRFITKNNALEPCFLSSCNSSNHTWKQFSIHEKCQKCRLLSSLIHNAPSSVSGHCSSRWGSFHPSYEAKVR